MSNFIGPALPPHLLNRMSSTEDSDRIENDKQRFQKDGHTLPSPVLQADPEDTTSSVNNRELLTKQIIKPKSCVHNSDLIGPQLPPQVGNSAKVKQRIEVSSSLPPSKTFDSDKESNKSTVGPVLPLKLRTKLTSKSSKSSDSSDEETSMIGPVLPQHLKSPSDDESQDSPGNVCVIGPRLPPFLTSSHDRQLSSAASHNRSNESSIIGPSLPTYLKSKLQDELPTVVDDVIVNEDFKLVIGPSLPPHLRLKDEVAQDEKDGEEMYGPALPPGFRPKIISTEIKPKDEMTECDEDMGPLPEENMFSSKVQHQLELRARQLREAMAAGDCSTNTVPTQRESWMLELPADRAPELGLRPRQFRVRGGPEAGDRSVWTDTPADRERKKKAPRSRSPDRGTLEKQAAQERDKAMQQLAEQHSSKRGTRSLVELHEEKLLAKRKKAEAAGEVQERRPFSREVDLQVNRFDEAQKRSILKKAQHLNDRFSSGQGKFL